MEIDMIKSMMDPEIYGLAVALYFIGLYLRKSKLVRNTSIPVILGAISLIFVFLHLLITHDTHGIKNIANILFVTFVQGTLCASASVYAHQIFKQAQYRKEENEENNKYREE